MMGIKSPPESNRRSKHRARIRRFGVRGVTRACFLAGGEAAPNPGPPSALKRGEPGSFRFASRGGFVIRSRARKHWFALFLGSSVVEQPAVNRLVAGSNP